MGSQDDERTPLTNPRRPRWRLAAACCAAALVGAAATRRTLRPLAQLTINSDNVDDAMVDECVSRQVSTAFLTAIGAQFAGWRKLPSPLGATVLVDRGAFLDLRNITDATDWLNRVYDWAAVNAAIVAGYDGVLALAEAGALESMEWDYTCTLQSSTAIGCAESCVEDRFQFLDGGAYAACADPVEAAFVLAPDLIKSCLVDDVRDADTGGALAAHNLASFGAVESCYECVSLCIGEARTMDSLCEYTGPALESQSATKEGPVHDAPVHDAPASP